MKVTTCIRYVSGLFVAALLFTVNAAAQTNAGTESKITTLIRQMTLEEKVGQMAQIAIDVLGRPAGGNLFNLDSGKMNEALVQFQKALLADPSSQIALQEINTTNEMLKDKAKLPEGTEMVMPGDNVSLEIELHTPVAMEKGLRFAIREGGRTVGAGTITEIVK